MRGGPLLRAARAAVLVALVFASPARALERPRTAGALLRCVQERYRSLRDLSADFSQESRVASLGRPRSRSGRLFFQAPGRMRWEYDGPDAQLIVSDGKQLWFHRPERRQVVVQSLDAAYSRQTPLLFLFGRGDFASEFSWEEREIAPGAAAASLELRPRVESPELVRLVLEIDAGTCRLSGTTVEDAFGNVTRLAFSAERADTGLDPALFRFKPPRGTEIVRP